MWILSKVNNSFQLQISFKRLAMKMNETEFDNAQKKLLTHVLQLRRVWWCAINANLMYHGEKAEMSAARTTSVNVHEVCC